jgi:hypothetical protein
VGAAAAAAAAALPLAPSLAPGAASVTDGVMAKLAAMVKAAIQRRFLQIMNSPQLVNFGPNPRTSQAKRSNPSCSLVWGSNAFYVDTRRVFKLRE